MVAGIGFVLAMSAAIFLFVPMRYSVVESSPSCLNTCRMSGTQVERHEWQTPLTIMFLGRRSTYHIGGWWTVAGWAASLTVSIFLAASQARRLVARTSVDRSSRQTLTETASNAGPSNLASLFRGVTSRKFLYFPFVLPFLVLRKMLAPNDSLTLLIPAIGSGILLAEICRAWWLRRRIGQ